MSMLWVDKYRPKELSALDYHIQQAEELKNLVEHSDFPHLLVYGPSGAGKKTRIMCILKELFGPGVERLKMEPITVTTPSNKKVEIMTVNSNYHIEINPSDVGIYDRVVVMDLIKNIAQTQQIGMTGNQRDFKVVLLTEVDNLTKDAQHALRRTMEKYSANCRLILCATSLSPVIPAIQSRCLPIRVAAPSVSEIATILQSTCEKEDLELRPELAEQIATAVNGNLRRALLICEVYKMEHGDLSEQVGEPLPIPEPDWKVFVVQTASLITSEQSIENLMAVRERLYELLSNGIPPEIVLKELLTALLMKCDKHIIPQVLREAALYEYRMTQGNKHIVHLEAFVTNEIQEGFLCPICHKDMRSPSNLLNHFQDQHSEDQEFLKSLKGIYGKAKKKILKLDDQELQTFKELTQEKFYLDSSDPQEPGPSQRHTNYFKEIRRERLDHRTTETNKLIIRLDRLLRTYGSDRKQQEQELVVWLDGSTVTRCPSCAASFNIARRQHHCRLCGTIMCNNCSHFLPFEAAHAIVAPLNNVSDREYLSKDSDTLRICSHCLDMLECRRKAQIDQMVKPTIWQLYSLLQGNKKQIQSSVELYNKMFNSLTSGETTFLLQDVQALRSLIAEKAQMIDTLSKKIATEMVDSNTPKAAVVQSNIRKSTSNYIKDSLLTLPAPPSVAELEKIRQKLSLSFKEDSGAYPAGAQPVQTVTVTTGWSPAPAKEAEASEEHPLIEQMRIVKNYIDQARKAHRFEEVVSLEENLRMLQDSYRQLQATS
ncbi:hypothetical protein D910_10027 [Dendroctonus ponderosae]|uniref:FYVE-type domain-containing protein n=1 Tax=Dendroctonus ponderosae TaxID=77166 RepID=U4UI66_DENPD|nr:hypothetical protein D910_10027 [Dendroctonus ponderosae]